ncbi:MAG: oligosaccharide flippase family protein [Gemmatimonadota bacterium]|nr:oligosaccharide flippase family protein [Gemmatimonadota bacterium]
MLELVRGPVVRLAQWRPITMAVGELTADADRAAGVMALAVSTIGARLATLVASVLVARELGVADFGAFGLLQAAIATFQVFAGFGLGETATKYVAELREAAPARAARIVRVSILSSLATGLACTLAVAALAPLVAARMAGDAADATLVRVAAPALWLGAVTSAQMGALTGLQAFGATAWLTLASGVLSGALLVVGARVAGLYGAVAAIAGSAAVAWLFAELTLRRHMRLAGLAGAPAEPVAREWRVLFDFSLPAVAGGLLVVPVHWWCATVLARTPDGMREVGLFNAANQWYQALLFIPALVGQVTLPALARRMGVGDRRAAVRSMWRAVRANAFLGLGVAAALGAGSPWIMAAYGDGFQSGTATLVVAAATGALVVAMSPVGHYIAATGRMWGGFAFNAAWAVTFVVGTSHLVRYGSLGLAGARLVAYVVLAVALVGFALRLQGKVQDVPRAAFGAGEGAVTP